MTSIVTKSKLKRLIRNGRKRGKDVSGLERQLRELKESPIPTVKTPPGTKKDFKS